MGHKRKKAVKLRGSRSHGFGSHKKHRGSGSKGGKGFGGSMHQKASWFEKNMPDHIGKKGFKSLKTKEMKPRLKAINLRDINKLLGDKSEIDLSEHGYDKVLSSGSLSKKATVKAAVFSVKAKEKIEAAGGQAVEA